MFGSRAILWAPPPSGAPPPQAPLLLRPPSSSGAPSSLLHPQSSRVRDASPRAVLLQGRWLGSPGTRPLAAASVGSSEPAREGPGASPESAPTPADPADGRRLLCVRASVCLSVSLSQDGGRRDVCVFSVVSTVSPHLPRAAPACPCPSHARSLSPRLLLHVFVFYVGGGAGRRLSLCFVGSVSPGGLAPAPTRSWGMDSFPRSWREAGLFELISLSRFKLIAAIAP